MLKKFVLVCGDTHWSLKKLEIIFEVYEKDAYEEFWPVKAFDQ